MKHYLCRIRDRRMSRFARTVRVIYPNHPFLPAQYGSVRSSLAFLGLSEMGAKRACLVYLTYRSPQLTAALRPRPYSLRQLVPRKVRVVLQARNLSARYIYASR